MLIVFQVPAPAQTQISPTPRSCEFYGNLPKQYSCEPREMFLEMINLGQVFCGRFRDWANDKLKNRMDQARNQIQELAQGILEIDPQALSNALKQVRPVPLEADTQVLLLGLNTSSVSRTQPYPSDSSVLDKQQILPLVTGLKERLAQFNELARANRWVWDTMECLQESLIKTLIHQDEPKDRLDCARIYNDSIQGHLDCYRRTGFCEISPFWREILFNVIGLSTLISHPIEAAQMPNTCDSIFQFLSDIPDLLLNPLAPKYFDN